MPTLAIFDIDGTLTATNAVDDECYIRAAAETFGLSDDQLDWSGAPHITDVAIAHWLCEQHLKRTPNDAEINRMIARFVEILGWELARSPDRFLAIAGAHDLFAWLREQGWDIALATGGWRPSARMKLRAAGLDQPGLILSCANDAHTRQQIVRLAHDRAVESYGHTYSRVVSVGDGVWDVRTAAEMRLPFIGIADGEKADRLRAAGAQVVLRDFVDRSVLSDALATAPIPVAP